MNCSFDSLEFEHGDFRSHHNNGTNDPKLFTRWSSIASRQVNHYRPNVRINETQFIETSER